jgi:hypothetical protein
MSFWKVISIASSFLHQDILSAYTLQMEYNLRNLTL